MRRALPPRRLTRAELDRLLSRTMGATAMAYTRRGLVSIWEADGIRAAVCEEHGRAEPCGSREEAQRLLPDSAAWCPLCASEEGLRAGAALAGSRACLRLLSVLRS